jgi:glutamyl-tRNA reductase
MAQTRLTLVGVNHKTTPLAIREQLAVTKGYEDALAALSILPQCLEYYLISTCNRVELVCAGDEEMPTDQELMALLFGEVGDPEQWSQYCYAYHDSEAVRHFFQVAASLDSLVVGEAQILGQIKEAYRHAAQANATGPLLNKLLHKSFSTAKRVRSETGIGASAVSISSAAVELAKKIFGSLDDKQVLLIGAGEMAELAAQHLLGQGVAGVMVANRTFDRAVALAARFKGGACLLSEIDTYLETADIVISSTGSTELIIQHGQVKPLMRARRNRSLFFIDIAVPRDLDPALNEIDNVYLYDIDDLGQVVTQNRAGREQEAVKAHRIVDEETVKFSQWLEHLQVTPTIAALKSKTDAICAQELAKTLAKVELSKEQRQHVEKMMAAVTAKFLHSPLIYLKKESCRPGDKAKVDLINSIFALDEDELRRN